jgi:hypothetical protein
MPATEVNMTDERRGLPSASPWRRYELCAGSWQLEQEAARIGQSAHVESEDAARGDRIHAWLAGQKLELVENEATTAANLKERGEWQIERIFEGREYKQLREKRLWLHLDGKPALSGRFDVVTYTNELALCQDYKTSWSEPDAAEDNAQLTVLAVLIALNLPTVKEVIVQIVSGPYGITEARYSIAQLSAAYEDIVRTLRAINAPDAPFSPSPEACKFCAAINICQAIKDQIVKPLTRLQMSALPEGGERAAKLLDEVEIMAGLLKEIKKFYAAKFEDPAYTIPGYAMVPGASVRSVTDWDAARGRLSEFLPIEQLNSAADYRLGELEKSLGKALKLKAPQAKEKMNQILDGLVETKQNQSSLRRIKENPALAES